uniref:MAGUK p55 subfamily member 7 n=2 Tax=Cacopsylla melanoneura TaxID=428564 RepID=A0A8D8YMJ6_9HEMI
MTEVMTNIEREEFDISVSSLLETLQQSQSEFSGNDEELVFLSSLLQSKELNALVHVHNSIVTEQSHPVLSNAMQISLEVLDVLLSRLALNEDCKELFVLLQRPNLQGLLCAHDAVAQKDYYPRLPEIPQELLDDDEETVKIVQLVKSNEPLGEGNENLPVGATIKTDEETGKIVVARVMHGGAADRSGLIHVGDEVCEVNGINVEGKTPGDVLKILQSSEGTITFKLIPAEGKMGYRESKVRVRAHFDYDATNDPYIPCKDAGLNFKRGEILHVVSQDDAYWWQARKEGDKNLRAGIIPSKALQERKILHERSLAENGDSSDPLFSQCGPGGLGGPSCIPLVKIADTVYSSPTKTPCSAVKTKKILYDLAETDDFDREEIPTYEEVAKLYPLPDIKRPVVLIGPSGVGRSELKRRLIALDPDKFTQVTPYTTRPKKPGEEEGKEYHFVSHETMTGLISAGKMIEFGEYKGHLYGTSSDSVLELIKSGRVAVLNPAYQSLKVLRSATFKPLVLFIAPPSFSQLKESRMAAFARSPFDQYNSRAFTDDEFHDIIRVARRIEFLYHHWFDEVIVNEDLGAAFEQLLRAVERTENEPTWVPASWVQ